MQVMLGFTIMFIAMLGLIIVAKVIVTSVLMTIYRLAFAGYYFVKHENVNYKLLILKGDIVRPVEPGQMMSFTQVQTMKKSA